MKLLIIGLTLLSLSAFAKRKVSNTSFYYCSIERNGDLNKNYRSEFVLHLSKEPEEMEIKKSKRWNNVIVKLTTDYKLEIKISERYRSFSNEIEQTLNPEGLAHGNPVAIDQEFKLKLDEKEIVYRLQCE